MDHVKSHFFISSDGTFFKELSVLVLRPIVYGFTAEDCSSTLLFTIKGFTCSPFSTASYTCSSCSLLKHNLSLSGVYLGNLSGGVWVVLSPNSFNCLKLQRLHHHSHQYRDQCHHNLNTGPLGDNLCPFYCIFWISNPQFSWNIP